MGPLTDKYCIVGVGETAHSRNSGRSTLSMASEAVSKALADAGLSPKDVDGITSYQNSDSAPGFQVAHCIGMRPNYAVDIYGGGSSIEALIGHAVGLMEGGYCKGVVLFRSMNGRSGKRMGGQATGGPASPIPVSSPDNLVLAWGWNTPAQRYSAVCMRYMYEFGLTSEQMGLVAIAHRKHALLNPKALMKTPITMQDYLSSRWVSKPFRLLDCCLETDVAAAMVLVPRDQARDLRHPPIFVMGGAARVHVDDPAWNYSREDVWRVAGFYARERTFATAGIKPEDVDLTSSYDAMTFTTLIQLEAYGFAPLGEAGPYVAAGNIDIDGRRPNNTSGGHLSEGYTHGVSMVIENVRQLRHRADDSCPRWREGIHTYDRTRGCRQVRKAEIAACLGWGTEVAASAAILRR